MNHVPPLRSRLPALLTATLLAAALVMPAAGAVPTKELVPVDHWFHGEATDQLHKADRLAPGQTSLDSTTPTFSEDAPAGGDSAVQTTSGAGAIHDGNHVGSAEAVYWRGPFAGELGGDLALRLHTFTVSPFNQAGADLRFTVWADPDWVAGTGTLLGELDTSVRPGLGAPTPMDVTIPVFGNVTEELVIQAQPRFWNSSGFSVRYGSAEHDSGFTLPVLVPIEES
jgi:hypothetical protein